MRCTLVLEFDAKDAQPRRVELLNLHRDTGSPTEGDIGLTLAEAKTVLLSIQQEVVAEQLARYCAARRSCACCNAVRKLHDSGCSELCTVLGRVSYVRERWKACDCGADDMRYISPLKTYLLATHTAELKWLHAKLGAMLPYRQALEVLALLLPSSGRDSHVTIRNHTIEVGQVIRHPTRRTMLRGIERPSPNWASMSAMCERRSRARAIRSRTPGRYRSSWRR